MFRHGRNIFCVCFTFRGEKKNNQVLIVFFFQVLTSQIQFQGRIPPAGRTSHCRNRSCVAIREPQGSLPRLRLQVLPHNSSLRALRRSSHFHGIHRPLCGKTLNRWQKKFYFLMIYILQLKKYIYILRAHLLRRWILSTLPGKKEPWASFIIF